MGAGAAELAAGFLVAHGFGSWLMLMLLEFAVAIMALVPGLRMARARSS
jgi:hypothetical protein